MPFGIEKIFSGREKREDKKEESNKELGGFRVGQSELPEAVKKETETESKEPQLHGFKIGDQVLLRDSLRSDDVFKTTKAEIAGPAKNANQVQIKIDNPDSPFGPKLVYGVRPGDLIKLTEHEQRMAKQLGIKEVKFFKKGLAEIEKMEKLIAGVKSKHIFDKAMEDKIWEFRRVSQQFKDKIVKDKFEKKRWENIRLELWNILGKIPYMLDDIEENYPSDDWERVRVRQGWSKK